MNRLEFEKAVGHAVSEDDYLMAELILANTRAITGDTEQMAHIYNVWGSEAIKILFSMVKERGELICEIGKLRAENSSLWKENRELKAFRNTIIQAAEKKAQEELPPEGNRC